MEVKFIRIDPIKLCYSSLAEAPERLYSIHMIFSSNKFILTVKYTVAIISVENQRITSFPSIHIDSGSFEYLFIE